MLRCIASMYSVANRLERAKNAPWRSKQFIKDESLGGVLHGADELILKEFGLTCLVRDVYRDTPLGE